MNRLYLIVFVVVFFACKTSKKTHSLMYEDMNAHIVGSIHSGDPDRYSTSSKKMTNMIKKCPLAISSRGLERGQKFKFCDYSFMPDSIKASYTRNGIKHSFQKIYRYQEPCNEMGDSCIFKDTVYRRSVKMFTSGETLWYNKRKALCKLGNETKRINTPIWVSHGQRIKGRFQRKGIVKNVRSAVILVLDRSQSHSGRFVKREMIEIFLEGKNKPIYVDKHNKELKQYSWNEWAFHERKRKLYIIDKGVKRKIKTTEIVDIGVEGHPHFFGFLGIFRKKHLKRNH